METAAAMHTAQLSSRTPPAAMERWVALGLLGYTEKLFRELFMAVPPVRVDSVPDGLHVAGNDGAGGAVDLELVLVVVVNDLYFVLQTAVVVVPPGFTDVGAGGAGYLAQGDGFGLLQTDVTASGGLGRAGVVVGVVVVTEDIAGDGVDLVIVLLVVGGVELHVVDGAAVIPIQLGLDKGHLRNGQAGMGEGLGFGGISGEVGAVGAGLEAVGVGDQIAGAVRGTAEGHRLGGAVPADRLTHQFTDGPDGQIGDAIVEQGIDAAAVGVAELGYNPVHDDGEVVPQRRGDGGFFGVDVGGAGGGCRGAGAGQGNGFGAVVPVHILVHQLTDGTDGEVCGAGIGQGMGFLAGRRVEGLALAVHHNGTVGRQPGTDGTGGHGRGGGGQQQRCAQDGGRQTAADAVQQGLALFHDMFSFSAIRCIVLVLPMLKDKY